MKYSGVLGKYLSGVKALEARTADLSEKDMNHRPGRPDAWTIKEHIIHLVDSEVNGFIRAKSIIAQPNTGCYVMDEDLWTKNIARKDEDVRKYLQLFGLVRGIVHDLMKDEPEENWTKDYFIRKYRGEEKRITIERYFELYNNHLDFHLEYIDGILAELKRP